MVSQKRTGGAISLPRPQRLGTAKERRGTWYTLGKMFIAEPRCQRGKGTSASSSCIWLFGMLSALWYWSSPICTAMASPVTCKLNCVRSDDTQLAAFAKLPLWCRFPNFCETFQRNQYKDAFSYKDRKHEEEMLCPGLLAAKHPDHVHM